MRSYSAALTVVALTTLAADPSQAGAWRVEQERDSMTDAVLRSAVVSSPEGHVLRVWRATTGDVWATFRLSDRSLDVLGGELPMYRVDRNEAKELAFTLKLENLLASLGQPKHLLSKEPKWVQWQMLDGGGGNEIPRTTNLGELMIGSKVIFRYYLFTGGFKETTFSLDGAQAAIADACQVQVQAGKQ